MFRPRVIPCLLLKNLGLVKGTKFKEHTYIGDPMNAVRIFNEKEVDELILLDIAATKEKRTISLGVVQKIGEETDMPFAVGGGIRSIADIKSILSSGAEKVCINSYAFENPYFIREASERFGSSSIIVSIDVKADTRGNEYVHIDCGSKNTRVDPVTFAMKIAEMGAGEILINSIDKDGTMAGYDIGLIRKISEAVSIPVIALGGAGRLEDLRLAVSEGKASAVSAGSLFVFYGNNRAVLITYPTKEELMKVFS